MHVISRAQCAQCSTLLVEGPGCGGCWQAQETIAEAVPTFFEGLEGSWYSSWDDEAAALSHVDSCNRHLSADQRVRWVAMATDIAQHEMHHLKRVRFCLQKLQLLVTLTHKPWEEWSGAVTKLLQLKAIATPPVRALVVDFLCAFT